MKNSEIELRNLAIASGMAMLVVVLLPIQPLKVLAGLALALYLPGRAMIAGLLVVRVTRTEEAALACGLSVCVTVCGGFILHFLGLMTTFGWALFLGAFTAGTCLLLYALRIEPIAADREAPMWKMLRRDDRASLVTAAFFCLIAFTIASAGVQRYPFFTYTELWIVPESKNPRNAINLGVRNREGSGQSFVVELHTDERMLARWATIHLEPDETWVKSVPLSAESVDVERLEARLFKAESPRQLYRRVWLSRFK